MARKYKWQVRFLMVYHGRALHNFFISCHRKYSGQIQSKRHSAASDGKFRCNEFEYTAVFLYSDWLYFLWNSVNLKRFIVDVSLRKNCIKLHRIPLPSTPVLLNASREPHA